MTKEPETFGGKYNNGYDIILKMKNIRPMPLFFNKILRKDGMDCISIRLAVFILHFFKKFLLFSAKRIFVSR